MHLVKALFLLATGAAAVDDVVTKQNHESLSTTFSSVSARTTSSMREIGFNERVVEVLKGSLLSADVAGTPRPVVTQVVTLVKTVQASNGKGRGSYSFLAEDDRTRLPGKSLSLLSTFDVVTSYVTIQPSAGFNSNANSKNTVSLGSLGNAARTGVDRYGSTAKVFETANNRSGSGFSEPASASTLSTSYAATTITSMSTILPISSWVLNLPNDANASYPGVARVVSAESTSPSQTLAVYRPWYVISQPEAPLTSTTSSSQVSAPKPFNSSDATSTHNFESNLCTGASATFTVTFDDLPQYDISSDPTGTDIPPISNPYRHLYWEDHFGYVPPPSDPFPPKSPPQLAVYRASNNTSATGSLIGTLEQQGGFGAGLRSSNSAYWIDAHSMWLGCSDGSPSPCHATINGYRAGFDGVFASQTADISPCPGLSGCELQFVPLGSGMTNLSAVQILASNVDGERLDYYIDDVVLSWSDISCEAQVEKENSA